MTTLAERVIGKRWVANAVFFTIAAVFAYYYAWLRLAKPEWGPASLEAIQAGVAQTPFQYRALVAWTVNWVEAHLLPLPGLHTAKGVAFVIEIASTFFLMVAFRRYLRFCMNGAAGQTLGSLLLMLLLPYNFLIPRSYPFWMSYDTPSLLFFTLGLVLMREERWPVYYALFAAATFNRETTCFLTVVYVFTALGQRRLPTIAAHAAAQFVIWAAIKLALARLYHANWGAGLGLSNAGVNLRNLAAEPVLGTVIIMSSLAFLWLPVWVYYFSIPDRFVRRSCWVGPVLFLGMISKGNLVEVRIYGEMIPVFLPAFILVLRAALSERAAGPASPPSLGSG